MITESYHQLKKKKKKKKKKKEICFPTCDQRWLKSPCSSAQSASSLCSPLEVSTDSKLILCFQKKELSSYCSRPGVVEVCTVTGPRPTPAPVFPLRSPEKKKKKKKNFCGDFALCFMIKRCFSEN